VARLKNKGVTFEQYDMPGLKTDENGIAELGGEKGAWFKDPEGNILALGERTRLRDSKRSDSLLRNSTNRRSRGRLHLEGQ
jgi:hypothetical protein